jgi:hypothetical protein
MPRTSTSRTPVPRRSRSDGTIFVLRQSLLSAFVRSTGSRTPRNGARYRGAADTLPKPCLRSPWCFCRWGASGARGRSRRPKPPRYEAELRHASVFGHCLPRRRCRGGSGPSNSAPFDCFSTDCPPRRAPPRPCPRRPPSRRRRLHRLTRGGPPGGRSRRRRRPADTQSCPQVTVFRGVAGAASARAPVPRRRPPHHRRPRRARGRAAVRGGGLAKPSVGRAAHGRPATADDRVPERAPRQVDRRAAKPVAVGDRGRTAEPGGGPAPHRGGRPDRR